MQDALIKRLLEAGVHFGHQTRRWNPKMAKFIFGERNGVYIVDLQKTVEHLSRATAFLEELASRGEPILFVGTKRQAQAIVKEEAQRCGAFYVTERWLGGMLTNFATIRKSLKRLKDLERMQVEGTMNRFTKKEAFKMGKEAEKLRKYLSGIEGLNRAPAALFIIDTNREEIAVAEARRLSIPIVGITDTNCNPDFIAYPIPGNDDAIRSIRLITSMAADAVAAGRSKFTGDKPEEAALLAVEEVVEEIAALPAADAVEPSAVSEEGAALPVVEPVADVVLKDEEVEAVEKKVFKGGKAAPVLDAKRKKHPGKIPEKP